MLDLTLGLDLPERADRVGTYLRDQIAGASSASVGEVRGSGQFTGVEIVTSEGEIDSGKASAIVEALKSRGVLIGVTGAHDNVLKIRPPLVFDTEHADRVLAALMETLG